MFIIFEKNDEQLVRKDVCITGANWSLSFTAHRSISEGKKKFT